jgi:hypothetical protein
LVAALILLVGCGTSGTAGSDATSAASAPTTTPLVVVTAVTEPSTVAASAGRRPTPNVAMEVGTIYAVDHVSSADANLIFTAPSPTSFPYSTQFFFGISEDQAGDDSVISVFLVNGASRFFKDAAADPTQLTNLASTLAATDPIGTDLFAQFEKVPGLTTTRLPGTQKIGGVDADILEYRVDDTLGSSGPCGPVQCVITFYVPGAALAQPAGETGRLALVTVGGSRLLLYIVDGPTTEQILSTMKLVGV